MSGDRERPSSRHWQYFPKDNLRVCDGCGVVFDSYNHDCPICPRDTGNEPSEK